MYVIFFFIYNFILLFCCFVILLLILFPFIHIDILFVDRGFEHHSGLQVSKKQKYFVPAHSWRFNIVWRLRDREVACSASERQGSNYKSCVWTAVSSHSYHHTQGFLLAQFNLYVNKCGLKKHSFHFIYVRYSDIDIYVNALNIWDLNEQQLKSIILIKYFKLICEFYSCWVMEVMTVRGIIYFLHKGYYFCSQWKCAGPVLRAKTCLNPTLPRLSILPSMIVCLTLNETTYEHSVTFLYGTSWHKRSKSSTQQSGPFGPYDK